MSGPTIASRLRRRVAVISSDAAWVDSLRAALPAEWSLTQAASAEGIGTHADILQHRFLLLDLDDANLDAVGEIDTLRREMMLNIPVLCLGGSVAQRDAARLARADRFFERDQAVAVLQQFCRQYDW